MKGVDLEGLMETHLTFRIPVSNSMLRRKIRKNQPQTDDDFYLEKHTYEVSDK